MTQPVRLRLSRKKGFDLQALSLATNGLPAVSVTRGPGRKWGNAYIVLRTWSHDGIGALPPFDAATAEEADREGARIAVESFRIEAERRPEQFAELRGKNLACFCGLDASCHADVELEIANRPVCEEA